MSLVYLCVGVYSTLCQYYLVVCLLGMFTPPTLAYTRSLCCCFCCNNKMILISNIFSSCSSSYLSVNTFSTQFSSFYIERSYLSCAHLLLPFPGLTSIQSFLIKDYFAKLGASRRILEYIICKKINASINWKF